jgi:hypothetical protein
MDLPREISNNTSERTNLSSMQPMRGKEDWERDWEELNYAEPLKTDDHDVGSGDKDQNMRQRIECISRDIEDLKNFCNIEVSPKRRTRLRQYYTNQLQQLHKAKFGETDDQSYKIDYLLLRNFLEHSLRKLNLDEDTDAHMEPLLPFIASIIRLCELRQAMVPIQPKLVAQEINQVSMQITDIEEKVRTAQIALEKSISLRAAKTVDNLRSHLKEWFDYFNGYDPLFTWWVGKPFDKVYTRLESFASTIREILVGLKPGDEDLIVGEPIGREGLTAELEAEVIAYSPEELIRIGEIEYDWCEKEMIKASQDLGFGDEWGNALEHVKNMYVEPGVQPQVIRQLALEATEYVQKYDMITVPSLAAETWRMFMMSPEAQKVSPFFLGGNSIRVSYPTNTMDHDEKLMSMRGNNVHFSRSTVLHELIPGHRLQLFMNARHRSYRRIFSTPFCIEGWAFYWEMVLWDDKRFLKTPENRVGMLFWRMHRCARIIFSLKFHLGQMTPRECIDLLIDKVGHERSTAEGEVRRSLSGEYSPLYQAAYMVGALQLYALRQELVQSRAVGEKDFHDQVMRENQMPIELLRASLKNQELTPNFKSAWKFYGKT